MNDINSLINPSNSDYHNYLLRKNKQEEEQEVVLSREQNIHEQQIQENLSRKIEEELQSKQSARKLSEIKREIQDLNFSQAQLLLETLIDKVTSSQDWQLQQIHDSNQNGLLTPVYI
jgi:hypothetical protein